MSNVEQLPPTHGIADPHVRSFLDSLSNAWQLRNGNIGATDSDRFITKGEFTALTKSSLSEIVSGEVGAVSGVGRGGQTTWPIPGQQGGLIDALAGSVLSSPLFEYLGRRIEEIQVPDAKVRELENKLFVETRERVTAIQTEASQRAQDLLDEALARTNGDSALQTQIDVLAAASTGDLADLIAAIETETTARINGDAAEAAARQTLAAQMRGDYTGTDPTLLTTGLLYSERIARVDADGALAGQITALSATVSGNFGTLNAAITSEQTVRAGADTALSSSLNALTATVNSNYSTLDAAIIEERSVRAGGDTANANAISGLQSTVTNNYNVLNAAIISEASTRVSGDTANSNLIVALTARVDTTESGIATESTTRSQKDNALAGVINTLWGVVGDNTSIIQDGQLAAVNPVAATATKWNQVVAAVTDPNTGLVNSASIKQELNVYANAANSTMNATWAVRAEIVSGGQTAIGGFGLMATSGAGSSAGPRFDFGVRADRFWIASPASGYDPAWHNDNNLNVPFIVTTGPTLINGVWQPAGVFMKRAAIAAASIDTAKIADATITTAKIGNAQIVTAHIQDATITTAKIGNAAINTLQLAGNAVTVPASASSTSGYGAEVGVWIDGYSLGQPVITMAYVDAWHNYFGANGWLGGVLVYRIEAVSPGGAVTQIVTCSSVPYISDPGSGDYNPVLYGATPAAMHGLFTPNTTGWWVFRIRSTNVYGMVEKNNLTVMLAKR